MEGQRAPISEILSRFLSLNGGISGGMQNESVALPTGNANIQNTNIRGGGRVGVKIPISDVLLRLGASGYFNKNRTEFDDKMQGVGTPDQITNFDSRLTGGDIGAKLPNGLDLGFEFNTPHSKEREFMFRLKKAF